MNLEFGMEDSFSFDPFYLWIRELSELLGANTPKSSYSTVSIIKGCHLFDLGSFNSFKD